MDQKQERDFFEAFGQKMGECAREAASRNAGLILRDLRTAIAAAEQMGEDPVASGATELTAAMKLEVSHPSEGKALVRVRSFAWTRKTTRCDKDFDGEMVDMRQPELPFPEEGEAEATPDTRKPTRYELRGELVEALPIADPHQAEAYAKRIEVVERVAIDQDIVIYCPVMDKEGEIDRTCFAGCFPMGQGKARGVGWRVYDFPTWEVALEAYMRIHDASYMVVQYDKMEGVLVKDHQQPAVQGKMDALPTFFVFRR